MYKHWVVIANQGSGVLLVLYPWVPLLCLRCSSTGGKHLLADYKGALSKNKKKPDAADEQGVAFAEGGKGKFDGVHPLGSIEDQLVD